MNAQAEMAQAKSEYDLQAEKFLADNGIKFRATLSDSKTAPWNGQSCGREGIPGRKSGHHYRVTLSKADKLVRYVDEGRGKINLPSRLIFDFWGSIADAEKGEITVTPYDVLACIGSDANCPDTFEDWCSEMGDSDDSIKALQTYRRCHAFSKRLKAFFTGAELEQLSEIQ